MGTAYRAAKHACELAQVRLNRNPRNELAWLNLEHCRQALERVEAMEIADQQNRRVAINHTAA